uniref:Cystine/glutamate transporter-like isoform X2 n=1 Tax=Petromyzon marinus TaxID=7757 RepID=A0AAJ7UBQ2_PETMA|nr:cystine/glutamate transporter-like isoform X2 [Petromyzon marinus]
MSSPIGGGGGGDVGVCDVTDASRRRPVSAPPAAGPGPVALRRKIGLWRGVSVLVGTVVGSGVFISPSGVLRHSGSPGWALAVWLACGLLSLLGALSYAELGTTYHKSGGHYVYLLETLGPATAFLRLWAEFIIVRPAITAVVALAFGRYALAPAFSPCPPPLLAVQLVTALAVTLVVFVNAWSVSWTARIQAVLVVVKLGAIALIAVPGLVHIARGHTENFVGAFVVRPERSVGTLPLALYAGMFAYAGWFYMNFVTEEVKSPERTLPLAICISMAIVTASYLVMNVAYLAVLSEPAILASPAVAMNFAEKTLGSFSTIIPILVSLSCMGSMLGGFFASARMFFVASRESHWPRLFSMIHVRRHTPLPAVLLLVPLLVPVTFTLCCLGMVLASLYADPVNVGVGFLITLTGAPVYALTASPWGRRLRRRWRWADRLLARLTVEMQLLMEVVPQEVVTY